jgi:hypothetical protein
MPYFREFFFSKTFVNKGRKREDWSEKPQP